MPMSSKCSNILHSAIQHVLSQSVSFLIRWASVMSLEHYVSYITTCQMMCVIRRGKEGEQGVGRAWWSSWTFTTLVKRTDLWWRIQKHGMFVHRCLALLRDTTLPDYRAHMKCDQKTLHRHLLFLIVKSSCTSFILYRAEAGHQGSRPDSRHA